MEYSVLLLKCLLPDQYQSSKNQTFDDCVCRLPEYTPLRRDPIDRIKYVFYPLALMPIALYALFHRCCQGYNTNQLLPLD